MKKIGKIVLHSNAELLDTPEMKMIRGGYGGSGYDDNCCAWRLETDPDTKFNCKDKETSMKEGAPPHWWGCNSAAIKKACTCGS